ncbi:MAG: hypothetical protein QM756_45195, partial [Polyangiaceae bacterium]
KNSDKLLLPGMFADVELTTGSRKAAGRSAGRLARTRRPGARLLRGRRPLGRAHLSLGPSAGDRSSVLRGAALNEHVALGPFEPLSNGQRVR